MVTRLPLSALLGQLCVALTVEADNEFEHRLGNYFTTDFGSSHAAGGPWLTSAYCYINFLRLVPDDGIRAGDLASMCGDDRPAPRLFDGLRRWGYCTYTPDIRGTSPRAKDADSIVRCTPNGLRARATWAETFDHLVVRWSERGLDPLRGALVPVVTTISRALPEYLPLVEAPHRRMTVPIDPASRPPGELHLLSLIAQLLSAITIEFEERTPYSLATCASLLRALTSDEVLVRDLPEVTGVAKKDWDAGVNQLSRQGLIAVGRRTEKPSGKSIHLTDEGQKLVADYRVLIDEVERSWEATCAAVRQELERVVPDALSWTKPYPDNWRANRPLLTLPHQPIVSHRGGFPDGS